MTTTIALNGWKVKHPFDLESLPDSKTLAMTIMFCMVCEDFTFHFAHRLMHWKVIYPLFHKVHHQYITTVGIASEYSHPIDYIFSSVIPAGMGSLILGEHMHYTTLLLWTMVRLGETLDGHCGYEFSWSPYRLIPFSTSASYHNFHHKHNIGNYSSFFSLWDTIFGQNKAFYQYEQKMREAAERYKSKKETFEQMLQEKLSVEAEFEQIKAKLE